MIRWWFPDIGFVSDIVYSLIIPAYNADTRVVVQIGSLPRQPIGIANVINILLCYIIAFSQFHDFVQRWGTAEAIRRRYDPDTPIGIS
jgi:uncharacterized protein with PQ loop repeat